MSEHLTGDQAPRDDGHVHPPTLPCLAGCPAYGTRQGPLAIPHECVTTPLCDGWPFAADDAYRTIAAVAWPGEREENRDGWAVTMRHRPDLFEQEAARARERLEAAIAHGRAALVEPVDQQAVTE